MTRPATYDSLDDAARALASERGLSRREARAELERWLDAAKPPRGDVESAKVRHRSKADAVDVTYHLADDGSVRSVALRLTAAPGRQADRRHRERQAERRTWRDSRPEGSDERVQISIRVPADALETIDAAAEASGESRTDYMIGAALLAAAEQMRTRLTRDQREAIARELSRYVIEELGI